MVLRRWGALICCVAAASLPAAAGAFAGRTAPSVTTAPMQADPVFDTRIADAKAAMLADPERALALARQALTISTALPEGTQRRLEQATGQWLAGEALNRLNRPQEAAQSVATALATVVRDAPRSKLHGDLLMSRGQIAIAQGKAQRALADLQAAYRIFQALGERRSEAVALQNIGSLYSLAGDEARVLRYYQQSAEAYSGDPNLALAAHNNNGVALRNLGRYSEAEAEFDKALTLARSMRSPALEARVLNNLASAQLAADRIDEADATADAGLRASFASNDAREWQPFLWGVKAQVAYKRGNLNVAAAYLARTFADVDLTQTSPVYRDFHDTAQHVYSALRQESRAFAHLTALKRLDDETREVRASTNAALMAAQFDFSNQELRISRLKTGQLERDVLLAKSQARMHTIILVAVSILLLLAIAAYFSIRRSRDETRNANRKLSGANTALEKALKAKSEFLATTSHEIRTPLNGILGMTQVLLRDPKLAEDARDRVQVVQGAGEMMKAVVDDILDMAKIETGRIEIEKEEIELKPLLGAICGLWADQAAAKGVRVQGDFDGAPDWIVEDSRRLRQVVFNLMSNSTKFTEQGSVTLKALARPATSGEGEELVITVRDTGIGIAAEHLDMIFEPFRQVDGGTSRKFSGTGLGLAISRSLVEAMGGTLRVESVVGKGSTFTITLPLHRPATRAEVQRGSGERPTSLAGCRVLIAEPNPLSQSIIRAALEGQVLETELVGDMADAIAALRAAPFDIVAVEAPADLADLAPLREVLDGARLLLLAADPATVDPEAARAAGAGHVAKRNFPPIDLTESLAAALAADRADDGPGDGSAARQAERRAA